MEKGRVIPLAAAVKQVVKIPILCGGRMNDPDLAAQAIAQGSWTRWCWAGPPWPTRPTPRRWPRGGRRTSAPVSAATRVHWRPESGPPGRVRGESPGRPGGFLCPSPPPPGRNPCWWWGRRGRDGGRPMCRPAGPRRHPVRGERPAGGNLIPAGAHPFKEELNELNRWYQGQLAQLG